MKKILALVLCVLMAVSLIPMTVAAEAQWTNIFTEGATTLAEGASKTYEIDISGAQEKIEITLDWTFGDNRGGNAMSINGKSLMAVSNKSKQTRITVSGGTTQLSGLNNVPMTFAVTVYLQETVVGETTYAVGDAYTVVTNTTNGATSKGKISLLAEGQTELGDTLTIKFGTLSQKTAKFDNLNVYTYTEGQAGGEEPAAIIWADAYQMSAVENGVYSVRFAAILSTIPAGAENVGFEISATGFDKTWDLNDVNVYKSLNAGFGAETVTATDRGGQYITAAAITDIPVETGAIEFVVTPYVTVAGAKVYGEAVTVTVPAAQ